MKRTAIIAVITVVAIFGLAAYAGANPSTTVVKATARGAFELTAPSEVTVGGLDGLYPEIAERASITVTGKSNKLAVLSATVDKGTFTTLSSSVAAAPVGGLRGGNIEHTDTVSGMVDWSVDGDTQVEGSVTYTLVQQP